MVGVASCVLVGGGGEWPIIMREVTPGNAAEYLRETGRVAPGRKVEARAMGWGVSNVVIRVEVDGEPPIVLKQARERLRTEALWLSRLDRIWNERAALDLLGAVLPEGSVPRVVFADEDNYLFAMTCAPDDSVVWKEQLLAGKADPDTARRAGELLAIVHERTRDHPALAGRLADTTVFDELRIDPFYRTIARVHPEIAPEIEALIASMSRTSHPCLVLADFSPKNILVHSQGITLVDFETAHAGDPAFDLGFFLSHLWLKEFHHPKVTEPFQRLLDFQKGYRSSPSLLAATDVMSNLDHPVRSHMAACALARIDGKSPVDYLSDLSRRLVRDLALGLLRYQPPDGNRD